MATRTKIPSIVKLQPIYIRQQDALTYMGIKETLFRKLAAKYGLTVYAFGPKVIWYKLSEINDMMEDLKIKSLA